MTLDALCALLFQPCMPFTLLPGLINIHFTVLSESINLDSQV